MVLCHPDEVKPIRIDEESLKNDTQSVVSVWYQYPAEVEGAYRFEIQSGESHTNRLYFVSAAFYRKLIRRLFVFCANTKFKGLSLNTSHLLCLHKQESILI